MTALRALKRFCEGPPQYGLNVSSSEYTDGGLRFIRTTDIADDGRLRPATEGVFVPAEAVGPSWELLPGDLLFSRSGTLGKCLRYDGSPGEATFAGYLVRFRPREDVVPEYLEFCAQTTFFHQSIAADAISSTIANFNAERYAALQLPWWPEPHQRAIVDYLMAETAHIDALIALKDRLHALLEWRRRAAIETAVAGGSAASYLMQDRVTALPSVPLKHLLVRILAGATPDTTDPRFWGELEGAGTPWVSIGDMVDRGTTHSTAQYLTDAGLAAARLRVAPAGSLLFAMYASLGKLTVLERSAVWNQAILGLVPDDDRLSVEFLALWLEVLRPHLPLLARSNTQDNLNAEQVRNLPVPDQPRPAQDRIVEDLTPQLDRIRQLQERLLRQSRLLRERRRALVTAAVTGELEIPGVA